MAYILKNVMSEKNSRFTSGHRMCAGCGAPPVVRMILRAVKNDDHVVISNATGCLEVSSTIFPYTSWEDSYIHTAFASTAATLSGVETAFNSLKEKGKIKNETKFIAFGGDGGTYDIGLQSLSAAMERNHNLAYFCYNNGGYMNTGIQRSSATPEFATTTTTPDGEKKHGKLERKKDLTKIMVAHNLKYVAQTVAINDFRDLYQTAEKAIYIDGPTFVNVFAPCPRGWGYDEKDLMKINKLAVDTCYFPMYEVENGIYKINYKPAKKLPIEEFLKTQKRFSHLFEKDNLWMINEIQKHIDEQWEQLLFLEKQGQENNKIIK